MQGVADGSRIGAGQQRTLRSTSPQAARVDSRVSLIRRIVAFRSSFRTPWSWNSCRVVIRKLPLPIVWARWSQARYWSARQPAADDPDPDHELVGLLLALFLQLRPHVAVVLLVGPVELEDGGGVLGEVRRAVVELVGHEGLEILAGQLDRLDLARLRHTTGFGRLHLRRAAFSARRSNVLCAEW